MTKATLGNNSSGVVFVSNLPEVRGGLKDLYRKNLTKGILIWERSLKQALTGRRTGRAYKVSKTGKPHIASAPGEAPAVQFGALRASYYNEVSVEALSALNAYLGSELDYALWLERGTSNADGTVKMAPRPALEPSFLKVADEIRAAMTEGV